MKKRKMIGIVLTVAAVAGIGVGVWGILATKIAVRMGDVQGVYDVATGSYDGTVGFSTVGGTHIYLEDIQEEARSIRSKRIWIGFGGGALLGLIGLSQLSKARKGYY